MEGFAETRKQPRAVACLIDQFQLHYGRTSALTIVMFTPDSSYLTELLFEKGCEIHEPTQKVTIKNAEK
jgi:hypothetical protein